MAGLSAKQLRARKRRTSFAAWALSWALTLGGIGAFTAFSSAVLLSDANFSAAVTEVADTPEVRTLIARQLIATETGRPSAERVARVADALDADAVARVLIESRRQSFNDDIVSVPVDLNEMAPGLSPADIGTEADMVQISIQSPNLPLAQMWMPRIASGALLLAVLLAIAAGVAALDRFKVALRVGRWAAITGGLVAASGVLASFVPTGSSGLATILLALVAGASAASSQLSFGLIGVGVTVLVGAFAASRLSVSRSVALLDEMADEFSFTTSEPDVGVVQGLGRQDIPTPVEVDQFEQAAQGGKVAYWRLANHPMVPEQYRETQISSLDVAEQEALAIASVTAWTAGDKATVDDAQLLRLLTEDRGTYVQLARFWERFEGLPRRAAMAILAYQDIVSHGEGYARALEIPHWSLTERVGQFTVVLRDEGLDATRNRMAVIYRKLAETLVADQSPDTKVERERLLSIAAALS